MTGHRRRWLAGARAAGPLAVAVGTFGVSFGVLARTAGMGAIAPIVMSATTFAGSAQFAAVSVLGAAGGVGAAIVAAVLLNARYAPIGLSVAGKFEGGPLRRLWRAQLVVDESWAIGQLGGGHYDLDLITGAGLLLYISWVAGTAVGVAAGDVIGNPSRLGLDAAFPALFLALLVPQLTNRRAVLAAVIGGAVGATLTPFTSPGLPLICATAGALLGLRRPAQS